jgi:hypothetical protein
MKPPHPMSLYFFKIHFNILPYISKSSHWTHSSRFPHHNLILHLMTPVIFDQEYKPFCNTLHLPVTSSQTSVTALHYWTVSLCSLLTVTHQVPHHHIKLHFFVSHHLYVFGDCKLEHKRFWTELWQGYPKFIPLTISLCMKF